MEPLRPSVWVREVDTDGDAQREVEADAVSVGVGLCGDSEATGVRVPEGDADTVRDRDGGDGDREGEPGLGVEAVGDSLRAGLEEGVLETLAEWVIVPGDENRGGDSNGTGGGTGLRCRCAAACYLADQDKNTEQAGAGGIRDKPISRNSSPGNGDAGFRWNTQQGEDQGRKEMGDGQARVQDRPSSSNYRTNQAARHKTQLQTEHPS